MLGRGCLVSLAEQSNVLAISRAVVCLVGGPGGEHNAVEQFIGL
jgi:hypothetical protein